MNQPFGQPQLGTMNPGVGGTAGFGASAATLPHPQAVDQLVIEQFAEQMKVAYDPRNYKLCSFKHILYDDLSTVNY